MKEKRGQVIGSLRGSGKRDSGCDILSGVSASEGSERDLGVCVFVSYGNVTVVKSGARAVCGSKSLLIRIVDSGNGEVAVLKGEAAFGEIESTAIELVAAKIFVGNGAAEKRNAEVSVSSCYPTAARAGATVVGIHVRSLEVSYVLIGEEQKRFALLERYRTRKNVIVIRHLRLSNIVYNAVLHNGVYDLLAAAASRLCKRSNECLVFIYTVFGRGKLNYRTLSVLGIYSDRTVRALIEGS